MGDPGSTHRTARVGNQASRAPAAYDRMSHDWNNWHRPAAPSCAAEVSPIRCPGRTVRAPSPARAPPPSFLQPPPAAPLSMRAHHHTLASAHWQDHPALCCTGFPHLLAAPKLTDAHEGRKCGCYPCLAHGETEAQRKEVGGVAGGWTLAFFRLLNCTRQRACKQ